MSNDINLWTGTGKLGRDIEVKYTQAGKPYAKFSIAVGSSFKRGEEWQNETSWIDVTLWGKPVEKLAANVTKGTLLFVTGPLKQEQWEKDGKKNSRISVNASMVAPIAAMRNAPESEPAQEPSSPPIKKADVSDENLPF